MLYAAHAARRPPVLEPVLILDRPSTPVELPPQQGPICIFPLNMIPNCTPQAIQ
jgi:hypothetical protein